MKLKFACVAAVAALALAGCAAGETESAPAAPAASQSAQSASERLRALFAQSDEDLLRRVPLAALYRGDLRYADRYGDYLSDDFFNRERTAQQAELQALLAIDRNALNPTDQLAYDVFRRDKEMALRGLAPEMLALTALAR